MEFDVMMLPAVNASLNAVATVLLLWGYVLIRRKRWQDHKKVMLGAFIVSIIFLISYVTYHALRGGMSTPFAGQGPIRVFYYAMLITHVILAAIVPVLAIISINRGLRSRFDKHRRIARWTLPIWLYVSITGVLIYFMLYQWFPAAETTVR